MLSLILQARPDASITTSFSLSSDIVVPAIVALLVSGLTLLVTYLTTDRRAKFDAAFEAAKYREKWLSGIREEIVEFCSVSVFLARHETKDVDMISELITRRTRIELSIPNSNPFFEAFLKELDSLYLAALAPPKAVSDQLGLRKIMGISDKILKSEWDSIQQMLATGIKKEKKKI